jgi:WD40 repeat protein
MLRNGSTNVDSDRFISARSSERQKRIEELLIYDDSQTKCPLQIVDEKNYSQKKYLSLLRKQLFETDEKINENKQININSSKNEYVSSRKCSKIRKSNKIYDSETSSKLSDFDNDYYNRVSKRLEFNSLDRYYLNYTEKTKDLLNLQYNDIYPSYKLLSKEPFKILDAPSLRDDFYLHLLDWSCRNQLAVGLEKSVYIWNGYDNSVDNLTNLLNDQICSLSWTKNGSMLICGTNSGEVQIFDIEKSQKIHSYKEHKERVGVIATLDNNVISSGSQDFNIFNYDLRQKKCISSFIAHNQEVCGLKWSSDEQTLASGGNDNKIYLWNFSTSKFLHKFSGHKSAVKALGWSPKKSGLLASGGGTQDRCLKLWNTNTLKEEESIDTQSQVCNLVFSRNSHELVTTHGYSDNMIIVWKYPYLEATSVLKGHRERVVFLSLSPDSKYIVTGAGDETVRFWEVFDTENFDETFPKINFLDKNVIR